MLSFLGLRNVYGPTETTIWSSSFTLDSSLAQKTGNFGVSIGQFIRATDFNLVTEDKPYMSIRICFVRVYSTYGFHFITYRLVPENSEGELWIGGIGVARGYPHALDITTDKLLPNPFGSDFIYHTLDVVCKLQDGSDTFVFVRRLDDQVKGTAFVSSL